MRSLGRGAGVSKRIAVGLVGPGMIGTTLMRQIAKQHEYLKERIGVDVALVGVTSSRKMLVQPKGLDLNTWNDALEASTTAPDLDAFTDAMASLEDDAVVFDCTASDAPCPYYSRWMAAGVHIITPNKKLQSGPLQELENVQDLQARGKAHYFYEASCGAGLPILSTIKALRESGDKILEIEGVLSGTLSFLFNTWQPGQPFSGVVAAAKDAGFTEPDPREDLSGNDVARKVVILARESGARPTLADVPVESLVPSELTGVDVETYMARLPEHDAAMAARLEDAARRGEVLRYVGRYEADGARCSITVEAYPPSHPFAALSGTDNVVQVRTERYSAQPLIVRGPGAGAEVTAAGCFADFLQLLRYLGGRS